MITRFLLLSLVLLPLAAAACGGDDDGGESPSASAGSSLTATPEESASAGPSETPAEATTAAPTGAAEDNTVSNGSFEEVEDGWSPVGPNGFTISSDEAKTGSQSAFLQMKDDTSSEASKSYAISTDLAATNTPELFAFDYLVDHWVKGTAKQYIVATVVAFGGTGGFPPCPGGDLCPNYQIRYVLAGIGEDPVAVENASYIFVSKDEPVQGEWVHFLRNLRNDFEDTYGHIPTGFDRMRIIFEVRYDDRDQNEGPMEADVYLDDVYAGAAG